MRLKNAISFCEKTPHKNIVSYICQRCEKISYSVSFTQIRYGYCSKKCWGMSIFGESNPSWKNGGNFIHNGYLCSLVNGKRKYKHRNIMEKHIGRKLKKTELIHHKDGNRLNNSLQNLEIITRSAHGKKHFPEGSFFGINKISQFNGFPIPSRSP